MSRTTDKIGHWLDQYENHSLRERLLLLSVSLSIPLFLALQFWLGPLLDTQARWQGKIRQVNQQTDQFTRQIAKLESAMQGNPRQEGQLRLKQIRSESSQLDDWLKREQQALISPQLMPQVLQDMLQDMPLELISLRKLPTEIEIDSEIEGVPRVYRHGLHLEFEGSYRDTMDYLQRLEKLPWRFAWEALDIRMQNYPSATIILNLYTLSFEEGWLGV